MYTYIHIYIYTYIHIYTYMCISIMMIRIVINIDRAGDNAPERIAGGWVAAAVQRGAPDRALAPQGLPLL